MDGTVGIGSLSKLNFVPQPLGQTRRLFLSGGGRGGRGTLVQCATRTAAHGRLARLSPAAEPTRSFMFLDSLCSLFCPPLYSPGPQEGKKNTKSYVSSTCISFSLPPSISQAACAAGGSVWVQAARRTEVWVQPPSALGIGLVRHRGRGASRGPRAGVSTRKAGPGTFRFHPRGSLFPPAPDVLAVSRCSE